VRPRERIEAVLKGRPADRVPWALWRHFPGDDLEPRRLAEAVIAFQGRFGFDFAKVTPAAGFMAEAWGVRLEPKGDEEGTRRYLTRAVDAPAGWRRLPVLDAREGVLAREVEALRLIRKGIPAEVPVLQTVFSPLSVAKNLAGDAWISHLRDDPEALLAGLDRIAESTGAFVRGSLAAGADGIFFATQLANPGILSEAEYRRFGEPFDLRVIRGGAPMGLAVLHAHGSPILFDCLCGYPVDAINWHDRGTAPPLAEGLRRFPGACLGGIDGGGVLRHGTPEEVRRDVRETLSGARGGRLILGAGCVIPVTTPGANIDAVARELGG